jgi:hypothetical protein
VPGVAIVEGRASRRRIGHPDDELVRLLGVRAARARHDQRELGLGRDGGAHDVDELGILAVEPHAGGHGHGPSRPATAVESVDPLSRGAAV